MKISNKFFKVSKIVVTVLTIIGAMAGACVSIYSLFDIYRAKTGYEEVVDKVKENNVNIIVNREMIKYIQNNNCKNTKKNNKNPGRSKNTLPSVPIQDIKRWGELPIKQNTKP